MVWNIICSGTGNRALSKYTELGAKIALSKINDKRRKHKQFKKRKEANAYYCNECMAYHLTSIK